MRPRHRTRSGASTHGARPGRWALCLGLALAPPPGASALSAAKVAASEEGQRKPVFWVHVHNNAGTWLRHEAEARGERPLEPASSNWNFEPDSCHLPEPCASKAALAAEQGASWTSVERGFNPEADTCHGQFLYGIALRDPMEYVQIRLHHLSLYLKQRELFEALGQAEQTIPTMLRQSCRPENSLRLEGKYVYFDNFLVRSLLGPEAFWAPPGGLGAEHLGRAKSVLASFDIVVDITGDEQVAAGLLSQALGWQAELNAGEEHGGFEDDWRHQPRWGANVTWRASRLRELGRRNALDLELFAFARTLALAGNATA